MDDATLPLTARPGPTHGPSLRRLRTWQAAILVLAVLVHLSLLVSWRTGLWNRFTFDSVATGGWRGWDFFALYQAGRNVLDGVSAYESDNERIGVVVPRYTPFRYLPISAYTVGVALNAVSPLWAFRMWVGFEEVLLLGCAYLSWRRARDATGAVLAAAMWLAFTPYYLEIYLGQFSVVQAALVYLALVAWGDRRRDAAAGAPWIASVLWKQNTALLAPVFLRLGRWKTLLAAGLAVAITSAPYFLLYPEALGAFLGNFRADAPGAMLGNLGVRQWLYAAASALAPGLSVAGHEALQAAWMALVVGAALYLTFRRRADAVLLACLWMTTYFLVYHHVWEHHYVMALPVLVTLYRRARSPLTLAIWALLAVWTPYVLIDPAGLAFYHAPMRWTPLDPPLLDVAYHAVKALPILALWGQVAWWIVRRPAQAEEGRA
ncbi:MAG: DUF2029 domain-containing protein [Chloroflexi bacterium]|nr:DUF2029 domain-containing protein [Chloroflexota bacterium]